MQAAPASRLFFALWPAPPVRDALCAWRDAWAWPGAATPVHRDKLHVTLHFLGQVPDTQIPALAALDCPFVPFTLAFGKAALWPQGVAVLEPLAVPPALTALHAGLKSALEALGLACDARPFRPHVTLARRAGRAVPPAAGPALSWQVDGYALVVSRLGGGAQYEVLRHYP